ncbi:MAG: hypothetical protein ABUL58_03280, partial [Steroidobacter sp.]
MMVMIPVSLPRGMQLVDSFAELPEVERKNIASRQRYIVDMLLRIEEFFANDESFGSKDDVRH